MTSVLGIVAGGWGIVMALSPVLQVRRMIVRRSSADLSLGYFGLLLPGFALWVGYGLTRRDWPLVIPNAIAVAVGALTVITGIVVRRLPDRGPAQAQPSPRPSLD
ncbi:MAG TPA: SemiSWEET family transporter [Micromonosporaceae bacterium]|jgi:uncharacterized protein with PQ loop repeat